ncbi:MAG: hypothetical protein J6X00_00410 [Clostridia bacterium]|nr:hypothetical protein [Clostridia bacterium]
MRKFEPVSKEFKKYNDDQVKLPVRGTKTAVCYDFFSPVDEVLHAGERKLIFTNVKAKFNNDEGLFLAVRSSMGAKGIMLSNGVGIIESDYYGNPSNDGNLGFLLYNTSDIPYEIHKGDKIGQGFFAKFLTVDNEEEITTTRKGGFGSTNK